MQLNNKMMDILKKLRKIWNYGEARTAMAAACAHSVSISIGICQGYSAILIPQLMATPSIDIDSEQASWIASLGAVSNPIGSILSGILGDIVGRRRSMQISSIPFIIGWIVIGMAVDITWLYAGRFITGIAAGMSSASYTYVTEISTPQNRGILQALGPICASLGILLTYCLGYVVHWKVLGYGSVIFGILTIIGVQMVPESPSWLVKKDKKKTMDSLIWLRRSVSVAHEEYNQLVDSTSVKDISEKGKENSYCSPKTLKPFIILILFFLCQEVSGIYTILYYAVIFFKDSEIQLDEYVASIIVGVIRFFMSIVAAYLIKKYARRKLCLVSATGMAVSMLITASYIKFYELNPGPRQYPTLPIIFVLLNVFFSMIGMLPIPWIMVGELFPLEVRGIMSGLVVCTAQFAVFACVKIHVNIVEYLNFSGALFIFAGASIFTIFFVTFMLPETKDKSLKEIEEYFKSSKNNTSGLDNPGFTLKSEQATASVKKRNSTASIEVYIGK